jgi:hypothetical protein
MLSGAAMPGTVIEITLEQVTQILAD